MKSTEEIAGDVFRRRDEYLKERRTRMIKTVSVLSCVCLLALFGTGVWQGADRLDADNAMKRPPAKQEYNAMKRPPSKQENLHYDIENTSKEEESQNRTEASGAAAPVVENPGDTGALTAVDDIWGGSYMDQDGRWVILLTEDTPENRQRVFDRNPALSEEGTIFQTATYLRTYLQDLMERLSRAELPDCVSSIGFEEDRNRVVVYLTSEDTDSMERIRAFDSIGGAIQFQLLSTGDVITDIRKGPMP